MNETGPWTIRLGAEMMAALPDRALWWPRRRALLVADLHLEKASWYAGHGQYLPPYDSIATLARLTALAARLDAHEIWMLGDSFHDADGVTRLPEEAQGLLAALAGRHRLGWIAGNHDGLAGGALGGNSARGGVHDELAIDGIMLRHEACAGELMPEISGHYHPKLRIGLRGRSISRPCFMRGGDQLILPAFGALTGGLDVRDPVFAGAIGAAPVALVATGEGLRQFPTRALGGRAVA